MPKQTDDKIVKFKDAVASLNEAQRKAVETIEGPVMVIAGPGTGKTQVLTLRIANILLRTDTKPENILALTFTESGAKAMRDRLRKYIGLIAYRVPIFTFHGFAQYLISNYPEAFTRIIGGKPATDVEKIRMMENLLREPGLKLLRPLGNPTYYVAPLLSIISHLKQEYISPDDLLTLISKQELSLNQVEQYHQKGAHKGKVRGEYSALEKEINKNKELQIVYRLYEASLREAKLYDFDDMLSEAVRVLTDDEVLLSELQETFQYILADEHQDVNGSQNKILEQLANFHTNPNIFVVGDEKQAIYRFQGASLSNFLYFTDVFPTTTIIALSDNYRSGQAILDAAFELVKTDDGALMKLRIPLIAKGEKVAKIEKRIFSHQAVEDAWVVEKIKEVIADGEPAEEIAVIVRTNKEVETLTTLLRKGGIPVVASADGDILDHPITKVIETLIGALLIDANEADLFSVIQGSYWGLSFDDTLKIVSARSYDKTLTQILSDGELLKELSVVAVEKATRIIAVLEEAKRREVFESPHRVLEYLLTESGLIKHLLVNDPYEGVRVVRRLYDEIEALVLREGITTLRQVKESLSLHREYRVPLTAPYITTRIKAVSVMTAHKSKGLEFSTVFLPHLQDNNWGNKRRAQLFKIPLGQHYLDTGDQEAEDDERRLLYVALTRAKNNLYLSNAEESIQGKAISESRLLTEDVLTKVSVIDTEAFEEKFDLVGNLISQDDDKIDTEILTTVMAKRGLSATSLNNLLKNPWDFLYRNILRVPETQPLHMQFGTAIHNVLQSVTASHTKDKIWPEFNQIKSWLEIQLSRLPIHTHEYTELHEKGLETLVIYLEHLKKQELSQTEEEVKLRAFLPTSIPGLAEILLTGKLDRLDFTEQGLLRRVVDYKTGKPKSKNFIIGETANSDGGYKRQLTFYALLLKLNGDERYQSNEGTLSFVEANKAGKICEETFIISEEEIESLKEELTEAVRVFCRGDFLRDRALAETSDYKDLALGMINRLAE